MCSLENDGSGVLEAQVTINQTEPGVGKMTARSQGEESSTISYYVTPQITGEMVEENDGILLFETQNHLMGSYGMGRRSPNTVGFSSPERAFENYQGEMPLDGIYLESQIPITNTKMIHLSPIPDNETVTRFSPFFRDSLERIEEEADFSLSWLDGEYNYAVMLSTNYLECVLGNKTFDNTVVYVIVCQAMSDQAFVRLSRL